MLTTISKRFRWEMGHRLPMHEGLCKNLHGHSYAMELFLCAEPDASGMVMDYFVVSDIVQPLIDRLDHCFAVDASDTSLLDFLTLHQLKHTLLNVPTTAENLATYCLHDILSRLPDNHGLHSIALSIHETEKTSARVEHVF